MKKQRNKGLYLVLPFSVLKYHHALTHDIKRESLIQNIEKADTNFYNIVDELKSTGKISNELHYDIIDMYVRIKEHLVDLKNSRSKKQEEKFVKPRILQSSREIGEQIGEDKKAVELIKNLMETSQKPYEEVCKMLKISPEDASRYKKMI